MPDSRAYDVSWTEFRNEKLEHYNWNYMDQYICTHGDDDTFQLTDVRSLVHVSYCVGILNDAFLACSK